jgi:hypothetical protein
MRSITTVLPNQATQFRALVPQKTDLVVRPAFTIATK